MLLEDLQKKGLTHCPPWLPNNCVYLVQMGSVAYGVSGDTSDIDVYGYAIPKKEDIFPHLKGEIIGFGKQKENFGQWQEHHIKDTGARKEYDFSVYSIIKYFQLVMENNPNMVDSLFVPQRCILHNTPIGEMVREKRSLFLHKGCFHKFKGYAFSQVSKMKSKKHKHFKELLALEDALKIPRSTPLSIAKHAAYRFKENVPLPHSASSLEHLTEEQSGEYAALYEKMVAAGKRSERCKVDGFDRKFAYHVIRLVSECEQILSDHTLVLDEKGRREHMKAVRNGEWTLKQVEDHFDLKEGHLETLYSESTLQHKPDQEAIKELLLNCLEHHYGSLEACVVREDKAVRALRDIADVIDRNRDAF